MGMRPDDFEALTPAEFIYAWWGYSQKQETEFKQQWERTRWQTWILSSIQLDRKDRKSMTEMFPLPWEEAQTQQSKEISMQERIDRANQLKECIKLP